MDTGLKRLPARFYRSNSGREPVREWLRNLDAEDRKILGEDIKDVEFSWPIEYATGPGSRARIVGGAQQLAAGPHCPRSVLRGDRMHGAASRLHQEDPEDTTAGSRLGAQTEERRRCMKEKNIGSSFDSWLREEGIYQDVTATAIKRVLARQVEAAMKEKNFSKAEMARRMHTSRASLDRLLDPENPAVTLSTLQKAAIVVGSQVRLELA